MLSFPVWGQIIPGEYSSYCIDLLKQFWTDMWVTYRGLDRSPDTTAEELKRRCRRFTTSHFKIA